MGVAAGGGTEEERKLSAGLGKFCHVDEPARLRLYRAMAQQPSLDLRRLSEADRRRMLMLSLRLTEGTASSIEDLLGPFWQSGSLRQELAELADVLDQRIAVAGATADLAAEWPLAVHRTYTRDEILAAVGASTVGKRKHFREGVLRLREAKAEVFFVTLDKSEGHFSPTTSYEDYAISARLFHWQSQSTTSDTSESGRRYVSGKKEGWRFLLFVRAKTSDAYTFLGPVRYSTHRGSRPMSITWELDVPIPPAFLAE